MDVKGCFRQGLVTGLIGAAAVAAWFLLVDAVAGHPLFTPAMLGSAVFLGVRSPELVEITFQTVIGYTMLHVVLFTAVGTVVTWLAVLVENFPSTLFLVVVFFAVFEVGFYILVALVASPLLGALAWSNVAIGNLVAAGGMGYYLWRAHPRIQQELTQRPLGQTADGE